MTQSIRTQMMLLFSLIIIIPILLITVYVYYKLENHLERSYIRHQSQTTETLSMELSKWRAEYQDLSFRILGDHRIQSFLKMMDGPQTAEQLEKISEFQKSLQFYAGARDQSISVNIIKGTSLIFGSAWDTSLQSYIQSKIPIAEQLDGLPAWDNSLALDKITLFREIKDNETDLNRSIGFVFIVIDSSEISQIFQQYTLDAGQQFALKNDAKSFQIITDPKVMAFNLEQLNGIHSESGTFNCVGQSCLFSAKKQSDWQLITWISKEIVMQPVREVLFAILVVSIILILFSVFMVFYLSHRITKPLKLIQRKMKQIGGGFLELKVPIVRDDEVGQLAAALNRMSEEILRLIEQNRDEEGKRRRLQLQTLEYQINPHFLYNTLDSVNMLARKNNDPLVADIVTYLSRLFRIGLNQGKEMITVSDEISHVTYYLKIQDVRFTDQLVWKVYEDESIRKVKIIKFLLQPLVENSINHGIRKRNQPGHVKVSTQNDDHFIILIVEDDGVGMTSEELELVRHSLDVDPTEGDHDEHGFGLRNVHQRIKLHYGPNYGIQIDSKKNLGTTVSIRLPMSK
jgi:two-component system sensor histidine kinase YesM